MIQADGVVGSGVCGVCGVVGLGVGGVVALGGVVGLGVGGVVALGGVVGLRVGLGGVVNLSVMGRVANSVSGVCSSGLQFFVGLPISTSSSRVPCSLFLI